MVVGAWKHLTCIAAGACAVTGCLPPGGSGEVPPGLRVARFTLPPGPEIEGLAVALAAADRRPAPVGPTLVGAAAPPSAEAAAEPQGQTLAPDQPGAPPGGVRRGGGSSASADQEPPEPPAGAGPGPLTLSGEVRLALGADEGPALPGATITAHGAFGTLSASTDLAGAFTLALPDGQADVVVSAPGHATANLPTWNGGPLAVHLAGALLPPEGQALVPVAGTVTDADGLPVAGAIVLGGDGRGGRFGPVVAGADGHFAGEAQVPTSVAAAPFTLFGMQRGGRGSVLGLGLAADLALSEDMGPVAIALTPPTGQLRVGPASAGPAWTEAAVAVRAANGARLTLTRWTRAGAEDLPAQFFAIPGLTVEASAAAIAAGGAQLSSWRADVAAPGSVVPALLAYPLPTAAPIEGERLDWRPVAGAEGYRLALREPGRPAPVWEGYTTRSELVARGLPASGSAGLELTLTALAGPAAGLRALAALPLEATPPRRLRWHDDPVQAGRWSAVTLILAP